MGGEPGFFEVLQGVTAVRRLRDTPVPEALIDRILEAAVCVPTGARSQPWSFIVLQSTPAKRFFADRYLSALQSRVAKPRVTDAPTPRDKSLQAAFELGEALHAAPVIILVCGLREWPYGGSGARRLGKAPPSLVATLPCAQNILLTCHALGLGASLTTLHQLFEEELEHYLELPGDVGVVAAIPVGFPADQIALKKPPRLAKPRKFYDTWGRTRAVITVS